MSCRDHLPVVIEHRRRFRRALKAENQPALNMLIAIVIRAVNRGSSRATAG